MGSAEMEGWHRREWEEGISGDDSDIQGKNDVPEILKGVSEVGKRGVRRWLHDFLLRTPPKLTMKKKIFQ